jgi:hopanoid biosynthesis associated protein HpnK
LGTANRSTRSVFTGLMGARLIVNADDFGLTTLVNKGILEAHRRGILTSTSIMAVGREFDHAVQLARANPGLDLGIHLTLVEEAPVLPSKEIPSLIGGKGRFLEHADRFAVRYLAGRISRSEVRRELAAQCRKVIDAGLSPTHLDSHQHVHLLPGVLEVVIELSREFGIPAIRWPHEPRLLRHLGHASPGRIVQGLMVNELARRARERLGTRTDGFLGFLYAGRLGERELLRLLGGLPSWGTWELGCHPGLPDPNTPYPSWRYRWDDELAALTSSRVRELVERKAIRLIGFRDLSGPLQEWH